MGFHDVYTDFQYLTVSNGLPVSIQARPEVSWFYAGFVIHAGAREDPAGRQGLAHVVEHLVGENVNGMTFSQIQKRLGALGGYGCFGKTSYLDTRYYFHVPADQRSIQEALTLFGTMLLLGRLTQKIAEEKSVIVREYHRKYDHQQQRSWNLQGRPFLFEGHPRLQSFHSAIGIDEEFMQSTTQEIQTFYDTYYVPKNMSLICLGQTSVQEVFNLLQQSPFAVQKQGQRNPLPTPFSPHSPQRHEQIIHLSHFSTLALSKAKCTFEWVLPLHFKRQCVRIFGDLLEDQLIEELRYETQLTYHVDVGSEHYQDCRTLHIEFEIPPEALETARGILWQVLTSIFQKEEAFIKIKQETLFCIYRMDYAGFDLLEAAMDDLAGYQRLISFCEEIEAIKQTTFEDMRELSEYLTPERHFCFIVFP